MSTATLALACVTTLKVLLVGEINTLTQIEAPKSRVFPTELPNNGFLLNPKPSLWEMGITFSRKGSRGGSNGGIVWFLEEGSPRWYKGQQVNVQITACPGVDTLPELMKQWGMYEFVN